MRPYYNIAWYAAGAAVGWIVTNYCLIKIEETR